MAALSNLPEKPDELIKDLSHKTKTQITSTRLKRTTGPKHKHKKKPKNVRKYQVEEDSDDEYDEYELQLQHQYQHQYLHLNRPKFEDQPSWRSLVNKRNDARCRNISGNCTPRNSLITHNGNVDVNNRSIIRLTQMLKRDNFNE